MIHFLSRFACHIFCAIAAIISVVILIEMFNTSAVLDFGDPSASCVRSVTDSTAATNICADKTPIALAPGDSLKMCFGGITWHRLVPSHGTMYIYDLNNTRHDFDEKMEPIASHVIAMPARTGPLAAKCRVSRMPAGVPPGPAILTGTFTSTDEFLGVTRVVVTSYPRMPFIAKAAP